MMLMMNLWAPKKKKEKKEAIFLKDLTVHKNNQRKIQQALLKKKANAQLVQFLSTVERILVFWTSLSHFTVYLLKWLHNK